VPTVDLPPIVASSPFVGVVGAGDPGSSRLVYAMVIGLVVVGIGLILLAIWILRQTRPDLDVLAPLERMGDGDWKKRDPSTQRRMLDDVRPEGAQPLAAEPPPPPIDSDFEQADHAVTSFSDLGPGLGGAVLDTAAAEPEASGSSAVSDDPEDDSADEEVDDPEDEPEGESVVDPEDEPEGESVDDPEDEPEGESVVDPEDEPEGESVVDPEDEPERESVVDPEDEPEGESVVDPADDLTDTSVGDSLSDPRG
jgi:hypothetical protein